MIRFVHTADIHFGMENYGRIDAKTGIHTRLLDFKKALDSCITYAIDGAVDLFVFAGDAYKTHHPSQTHQKLLIDCFMRLHRAKIPVVIVVGNHDHPVSFGKAHALDLFGQLPLNTFQVFAKPGIKTIDTKAGPVQIVGMPWPTRSTISLSNAHVQSSQRSMSDYIASAMATIIAGHAQELDPQLPAILVGHLTVSSGIFSGSEKQAIYGTDPILLPSQLAIAPFDYVALGHLHRYQNLNPHGHPAIVYSGSIERIDFGERKEEKGFCVVTIHDKQKTTHEFIKVPIRPFIQIELTLHDQKPQTEQILNELAKYTLDEAIVKIIYHLPAGMHDRVNIRAIQDACARAHMLVNILPIRHVAKRERRLGAKTAVPDINQLLDTYFDQQPALKEKKADLIDKTLALLADVTTQQEEQNS
jgi:exonuclease SbcD